MIQGASIDKSQIENVIALLGEASARGISIFLEGGKLKLSVPDAVTVDPYFMDTLKRNKEEIIAFLTREVNSFAADTAGQRRIVPVRREPTNLVPLSFAQESLWFIDTLEHTAHYHIPAVFALHGTPDLTVLEYAFGEIVNRHESLRTVFGQERGAAYQQVLPENGWRLTYRDGTREPRQQTPGELLDAEISRPFDLTKDHMLRVLLYKAAEGRHLLIIVMHHIAADGWSLPLFVRELVELYQAKAANQAPVLPRLDVQYADYAHWQRQYLSGRVLDEKLAYWEKQLAGMTPVNLPLDFSRPAVQSARGGSVSVAVDAGLTARLKALAKQEDATLYMLLVSVFKVLLYRYTGQTDISVGTPVANRVQPEVEPLIGYFVNSVVLRSDLSDTPAFNALLAQVRHTTLRAYDHQDVPFGQLVHKLEKTRDRSRSPLFQVMFVLENNPEIPEIALGDARLSPQAFDYNVAKFDLTLKVSETSGGLVVTAEYCADLFLPETMVRLSNHYQNLLRAVVENPETAVSRLDMLGEAEKQQLLGPMARPKADYPTDQTVLDLFRDQVRRTPRGGAVACEGKALSYAELDQLSTQLARYLVTQYAVAAGNHVGIKLKRSEWLIVSVLAVLKTGAAFVPIDPDYPQARIDYIESDSQCKAIIDAARIGDFVNTRAQYDATDLGTRPDPSDLAYVIYTSGTTGQPKGTMIEHRGMFNFACDQMQSLGLTAADHVLQFASPSFDAFCYELVLILGSGATLFIPARSTQFSIAEMRDFIAAHRITLAIMPPSYLALLEDHLEPFTTLVSVGEALNIGVTERLQKKGVKVFNGYGPTETTIVSTLSRQPLVGTGKSTIGRPVNNVEVYLLDQHDALVPFGCVGEICLGGVQVGRGYLNRSGMTRERFIVNPFGNGEEDRLYKTGDLARWLPDGNLEYLGRKDFQVKLRGFRVELGEIETVLEQHPTVGRAVVKVSADNEGNKRLIAYVVTGEAFDRQAIRDYVQSKLPQYMVPAVFVELQALPLNANGKVDRNALPDPDVKEWATNQYVAPANPVEETLAAIWSTLLNAGQVGVHHNFFELGGDSITAIQFVSRAKEQGLVFKVKDVFAHQTIAELASHVRQEEAILSESGYLTGEVGLLPIQKHFFDAQYRAKDHFNQSVLLHVGRNVGVPELQRCLDLLTARHDALRLTFDFATAGYPVQRYGDHTPRLAVADLTEAADAPAQITAVCEAAQRSLSLEAGRLIGAVFIHTPGPDRYNRLFIVIHHVAVDGYSWRIITEDLTALLAALESGATPDLGPKTTSYRQWQLQLEAYTRNKMLRSEYGYWKDVLKEYKPLSLRDAAGRETTHRETRHVAFQFSELHTSALLQQTHHAYGTEINDLLLSAFVQAVCHSTGRREFVFALEGHGREGLFEKTDLSKTVGWFTSIFPVRLRLPEDDSPAELIVSVKEQLRSIPNKGIGYGVLRYLSREDQAEKALVAPFESVIFNYLGNFDTAVSTPRYLHWAPESAGSNISADNQNPHALSVGSMVREGRLHMTWSYDAAAFADGAIETLANRYRQSLEAIVDHCTATRQSVKTPADYGLTGAADHAQLAAFLGGAYPCPLEDVYRLSPLQEGILFHSLYEHDPTAYVVQFSCDFVDGLDTGCFKEAWQRIIAGHSILRTGFFHDAFREPVQAVFNAPDLPLTLLDYRHLENGRLEKAVADLLAADGQTPFDLEKPPLMRFTLIRLPGRRVKMVWTNHHIILDGWSLPILMSEFITNYKYLRSNRALPPVQADAYKDLIVHLRGISKVAGFDYWAGYLAGLEEPTLLPFVDKTKGRNKQFGNRVESFRLDARSTERLQHFAQAHRITLNTLIQGAWAYLLSRYTGSERVVFGATVSGRTVRVGDIENRVGLYINTIPVCTTLSNESRVTEWLAAVQAGHTAAREHSHLPLSEIQSVAGVNGNLFDSLIVFENYPIEAVTAAEPDFSIENIVTKEQTNYSLLLCVGARETLSIDYSYNTAVLSEDAVRMMMSHVAVLLDSMTDPQTDRIGDLEYLTEAEKHQLLTALDRNAVGYPREKTIHELFTEQALATPDAVALSFQDYSLSYGQLEEQSNQLAHYLRQTGVQPADLVGVMLEREAYLLVVLLGVLKAGAAYLPIDPHYPAGRVEVILEDARVKALLTRSKHYQALFPQGAHAPQQAAAPQAAFALIDLDQAMAAIAAQSSGLLLPLPQGSDLAYVIYTSGSTGKPKGVMIEHHSVVNRLLWMQKQYPIGPADVLLQKTPIVFDVSVWELFWWGLTGASLRLLEPGQEKDPQAIIAAIEQHGVTTIHFVPSMLNGFLSALQPQDYGRLSSLRQVFASGEALKAEHVAAFGRALHAHSGTRLINLYGPTEATVDVSYYECDFSRPTARVPIGKPIDNTQLYVLDAQLGLLPLGVTGELCIAGVGLARGYLNNDKLTAEKFVCLPQLGGERVYRTGDVARWLPSGEVEYLGRKDHQVKLRGYRIELGEIEQVLLQHPLVEDAVVVLSQGEEKSPALCAYLTGKQELALEEVRAYLAGRLPEYLVPAYLMQLEVMPLTSNGKVDRKALPAPSVAAQPAGQPPRAGLERQLAEVWAQVLRVGEVWRESNFFSQGGDSMKAIQLVNAIRKGLGVQVSIAQVFAHQTLAELAQLLAPQAPGEGASQSERSAQTELDRSGPQAEELAQIEAQLLAHQQAFLAAYPALAPQVEDVFPASDIQQGMFYHSLKQAGLYHDQMVHLVQYTPAQAAQLEAALWLLIHKHAILRTAFFQHEQQSLQVVLRQGRLHLEQRDLRGSTPDRQWHTINALLEEDRRRPFDPQTPGLFRFMALRLAEERYCYCFICHHAIIDGWSDAAFNTELNNLLLQLALQPDYRPAPLASSYKDFVRSQLLVAQDQTVRAYWQDELAGYKRFGFASQEAQSRFFTQEHLLPAELYGQLLAYATQKGTSLKNLCFAAFLYGLNVFSYDNELTVGLVSGSRPAVEDGEKVLGCFLNTVPVRMAMPTQGSWQQYLESVGSKLNGLKAYDALSLARIVALLKEPASGHNPITDVLFNYTDFHVYHDLQQAPQATDAESAHQAQVQVQVRNNSLFNLNLIKHDDGLLVSLSYETGFACRLTAAKFLDYFQRVLQLMVTEPRASVGKNTVLSPRERHQLLVGFNNTASPLPALTLLDLFAQHVEATPQAPAAVFRDEWLTYQELEEQSNQLAHLLLEQGLTAGEPVALCLDRSLSMLIALLAVLKARGVYVPIEADYPDHRIALLLEDSQARLVLVDALTNEKPVLAGLVQINLSDSGPQLAAQPTSRPAVMPTGEDLAYCLYTSGTTGRPKGVLIGHAALLNFLQAMQGLLQADAEMVMLSVTSYCFDISGLELYLPLCVGGRVVIADGQSLAQPQALMQTIQACRPTHLQTTPSRWQWLLEAGWRNPTRTTVLTGGDTLSNPLKEELLALGQPVWNLYGPTETTIWSTACRLETHQPVSIGKPIANTHCYVLDAAGQLLPVGAAGELYISGAGLSRGYHRQEELTRERFLDNPYASAGHERLYRTGDVGKWLPNGQLQLSGRADHQVKLRGYRIELGEIESQLLTYPGVRQAVSVARQGGAGLYLAGYYVSGGTVSPESLRHYLRSRLPDYMVPAYVLELDSLPLTANGKLDRKALPDPQWQVEPQGPSSALEARLVGIWGQVLGLDEQQVPTNKSFFELGGHSVKIFHMLNKIQEACSVKLELSDVFKYNSIQALAQRIAESTTHEVDAIPRLGKQAHYAVSPAQERMYYQHLLDPDGLIYNISIPVRISGEADADRIEKTFQTLIDRHEGLRTNFSVSAEGVTQAIHDALRFKLQILDPARYDTVKDAFHDFIRPFDLSEGALLRAGLLKHRTEGDVLFVDMHHVIADGTALNVLIGDFEKIYLGQDLPPLALRYVDYAAWLKTGTGKLAQQKAFWQTKLAGPLPKLRLPLNQAREHVNTHRAAVRVLEVRGETYAAVKRHAAAANVSDFMFLLSAYYILLAKMAGESDVIIGSDAIGRTHPSVQHVIGTFVNILPLRLPVSPDRTYAQFLQAVRECVLDAYNNQDFSFDQMVGLLDPEAQTAQNPLVKVHFSFANTVDNKELAHFKSIPVPNKKDQTSAYEFKLEVVEGKDQMDVAFIYSSALYDSSTIDMMMRYFMNILLTVLQDDAVKIKDIDMAHRAE